MSDAEKHSGESFETSLRKLEDIVRKMEGGTLSLDQMLKAFEDGSRLVRQCNQKLNEVERRIELLVQKDGQLEGVPLPSAEPSDEGNNP